MKTKDEWITHSQQLAIQVMDLTDSIKSGPSNNEIIRQLTRCSNSVGANYRATKRAKSTPDFLNKFKIVEEECDETIYFLEILSHRAPSLTDKIKELTKLYDELLSVVVASINPIKKNNPNLK